jgi:3-hydroxy-9,10-secoandrosta-1,3,5(10)-triene-9,17-dione monooxygenase
MAIGANQCFVNSMRDKLAAYDGAKVTDDPFVRQRTANANAMIRSIDSFFKQRNSAMRKIAEAGGTFDLELRSEWKWDVVWIAKQAMEATNLVFKASGGGGIRNESPMQRFFRDIHAASNHAALNADKGSISAGGVFLGGSPTDVLI